MILRVLKPIRMTGAPSVQILPGALVELPEDTAVKWLATGLAEVAPATVATAVREQPEKAVLPEGEKRTTLIGPAGGPVQPPGRSRPHRPTSR